MRIQLLSADAGKYLNFAKQKWRALEAMRIEAGVYILQRYIQVGASRIFLRCSADSPLIRISGEELNHFLLVKPCSDAAELPGAVVGVKRDLWAVNPIPDPEAGVLDWKGFYKTDKDGAGYWTDSLSWNGPPCRYAPGEFSTELYRNGLLLDSTPYDVYGAGKVKAGRETWLVAACREGFNAESSNFGVKLFRKRPTDEDWEEFYTFTPPDNSYNETDKTIYDPWWDNKAHANRPVRFPWLFSGDGLKAVTQWPLFVEGYDWTYYTRPLEISLDVSGETWEVEVRWLDLVDGEVVEGIAEPWMRHQDGEETRTLVINDADVPYVWGVEWSRDRTLTLSDNLDTEEERILFADFSNTDLVVLAKVSQSQNASSAQQTAKKHCSEVDGEGHIDTSEEYTYNASFSYSATVTLSIIKSGEASQVVEVEGTTTQSVSSSSDRQDVGLPDGVLFDDHPDSSSMSSSTNLSTVEVVHADLRHGYVAIHNLTTADYVAGGDGWYGYYGSETSPYWFWDVTDDTYTSEDSISLSGVEWTDEETYDQAYDAGAQTDARVNIAAALSVDGGSSSTEYEDVPIVNDGSVAFYLAPIWAGFTEDEIFAINGTLRLDGGYEDRFYSRYQPDNLEDVAVLPAGDNQRYEPICVAGYMPWTQ